MIWPREGVKGIGVETAGSGQSPWAGGRCRPHSVVPQLCFRLDYLASRSLGFLVCSWGDGSTDCLVICSEQGRKGSSGNSTEHRQYGNRRPCFPQVCLQDQVSKSEQTCSRAWGWAPFGGSPCFLNLGRSSSSGQWQVHATPGSIQTSRPSSPRALCLGPREADGTGRHPPCPLPAQNIRGPGHH